MNAAALVLVLGLAGAGLWAAVAAMAVAAGGDAPAGPPVRPAARRHRLVARADRALVERGLAGDGAVWLRGAAAGAVLLAAGGGSRGGLAGGAVALGIGGAGVAVATHVTRDRGARLADEQLPALLEHAGRGLRSGLDLRAALVEAAGRAGAHGPALVAVVDRVDGGATWDDALGGWADDAPRPAVRLVAAAFALAAASGGRAAQALDGVASTLRARRAVAQEAQSLATQARASAAVLVALPLVVSVGGAAADPRLAHALLGTSWGLACVVAAVILDAAGALWMQRIVAASAR